MATERELKFSTADDHVPSTLELELALTGSGLSVVPGRVTRHVDVYYDVDGQLAAAGLALRLRRSSAGLRVSLKADVRMTGGAASAMHERSELELPIAEPAREAGSTCGAPGTGSVIAWPEPVLAALPAGVMRERLAPVAELRTRRAAFLITTAPVANGEVAPLAELAFDEVTCVAPGSALVASAAALFHEVEIEWLGEGSEFGPTALAGLETVAAAVGTVVNLTASPVAKLDRALVLLAALEGG